MKRRSSAYAKACGVLGLEPSTPFEEIARCYRTLAEELHPDKHPDDPAAAARITRRESAARGS